MGKFHRPTKAATATAKGGGGNENAPSAAAERHPIQCLTAHPNNRHFIFGLPPKI
jgi:hypothetical protein